MARVIEVTSFYQGDEEVLQVAMRYIEQGSLTTVNMLDLQDIAVLVADAWVAADFSSMGALWFHACEVNQASTGTGVGEGPGRWIQSVNALVGTEEHDGTAPDIPQENVIAPNLFVLNRVGIRRDRIGNVGQGRPCPEVEP